MKQRIISANPLKIFNPKLETIVATDASEYGLGGVLLQVHPEGKRPVAFVSCS